MTAAFFDLDSVAALTRAVERGEVPRPTDARLRGRSREPLWALDVCRTFVQRRHDPAALGQQDELVELL